MVKPRKTRGPNNRNLSHLNELLDRQRLAVLASHRNGQPYCSLVAIVSSSDLQSLAFATGRSTRKFENLLADPRVALMIDDRERLGEEFNHVTGVTAIGEAVELPNKNRSRLLARYLKKHPSLEDFVLAPDSAFVRVKVSKYVVVDRFQRVLEIAPDGESAVQR